MTAFFQVVGCVLITVILGLTLGKQGKDITLLLSLGACCMVLITAMQYFSPVVQLIRSLQAFGSVDSDMLKILLKASGIGLIAEIACMICNDSGNTALGKAIQTVAAAVILWLSIPLITALMELLQKMLGEV